MCVAPPLIIPSTDARTPRPPLVPAYRTRTAPHNGVGTALRAVNEEEFHGLGQQDTTGERTSAKGGFS